MSDYDEIADFVLHRHLCLGCIAAGLGRDRLYIDALLVDLTRLNRIGSSPGRCRECRGIEIVYYARTQ
jgi:hypothetical protein